MMKTTPLLCLALALLGGCVRTLDSDSQPVSGAVSLLEGSPEGDAVIRFLNDGDSTSFELLDDDVGLDRRAARNLVDRRDGSDGVFGTSDDDLFVTVAEVDAVSYVGASALEKLARFVTDNGLLQTDEDLAAEVEGVEFSHAQAQAVLAFVNTAEETWLRETRIPSRAVRSILAGRPIADLEALGSLYYVGPATLTRLRDTIAPGERRCTSVVECSEGEWCVGARSLPGVCRTLTNLPGEGDSCDADSDCGDDGLACMGTTVYSEGFCRPSWMRGTFTVELNASLPMVASGEPFRIPVPVYGLASVPEDVIVTLDIEHEDPTSLYIGLNPPTGQGPVALWDGDGSTLPNQFIDYSVERDNEVNGTWELLLRNTENRGEGVIRKVTFEISSRWD